MPRQSVAHPQKTQRRSDRTPRLPLSIDGIVGYGLWNRHHLTRISPRSPTSQHTWCLFLERREISEGGGIIFFFSTPTAACVTRDRPSRQLLDHSPSDNFAQLGFLDAPAAPDSAIKSWETG